MTAIRVTVCIATYRRLSGLDRLLSSLAAVDLSGLGDVTMSMIVLDNDEAASARVVVEEHASRLPDVHYAVEAARGISRARNRLVELALEPHPAPHYVAFVDDDEWVEPGWLGGFLSCAEPRVVLAGPVLASYDERVPPWIRNGGFFDREPRPTGSDVRFAFSGNSFVPAELLSSLRTATPFGEIFRRPGGEDTFFSVVLRKHGYRIRWCSTARVHEQVPVERATVRWLVRRAFNGGYDYSRVVRLTRRSRVELGIRVLSGVVHVVAGLALLVPAIVRGRAALVHAARRSAAGLGALAGLLHPLPVRTAATTRGRTAS